MLPQKLYEILRWIIIIVLPALGVLIAQLTKVWGWDIPATEICETLDIIAVFLGAIFGISKVVNDKKNK